MLRTRGKKIFADIRARKGRSALVILSILIGIFGATALVSMNDLLVRQLNEDLKPAEIAMSHVYVVAQGEPLSLADNQEYMEILRQLPKVTDVEGQSVYPVYWRKSGASMTEQFTKNNLMAFSEPFGEVDLEPIARLIDGHYPEVNQHQLAVDQRFADNYGISIGDKLVFQAMDGNAANMEWEIVGIVFHPYILLSPSAGNPTTGNASIFDFIQDSDTIFANYEDAQAITGFVGLNSFYLRYTSLRHAQDGEAALKETIAQQTPYHPVLLFSDDPHDSLLASLVREGTGVLNILAIASMTVSGFLVANVINTIILEQKKQIGVMKSLGATRFDNFLIYAGMAFIYGLIGTLLGIPLGIIAGSALAREVAPLAFTLIEGYPVSTTGVMMGIVLGLAIPVLAALIPVFNGTRVTILEATTDLGIKSAWGTGYFSRWFRHLPLSISMRQSFGNLVQKKGRLILTGITLTLAVAAFMGVTAVFVGLNNQLDSILESVEYEIGITPQTPQDFETIRRLLVDNFDDIEAVYGGYSISLSVEGFQSEAGISGMSNQLSVTGIDPASPVFRFDLEAGSGWQNAVEREGVVITRSLADKLGKGLGDRIQLSDNGYTNTYTIIGIDRNSSDMVVMDWRELAAQFGLVDPATNEPLPGHFFVKLKGDPNADSVSRTINVFAEILLANGINATFNNQPALIEEEAQINRIMSTVFNATSGIMAAIGAIGLLTTLSMAVYERQKEIGVMRSVGARSWTIINLFLLEGILVGVIAWIIAVPLSFIFGSTLSEALSFGSELTFRFPLQVAAQGFVGIVLIAAVASLWPSVSAGRKTVSEILRYQ